MTQYNFFIEVKKVTELVHAAGAQVYIDGANLNALLGYARFGDFGGDVSHLNLHKTFCIPHGGGGPGCGPIAAKAHLAEFLPGHPIAQSDRHGKFLHKGGTISAAPYGNPAIFSIPWLYIKLMGNIGFKKATAAAVLAANYLAKSLNPYFPVLYTGKNNLVAHECVFDLRPFSKKTGITVADVAKRLIDYGFHAPTMSFPVAGTLMVEPTESEGLAELDRFIEAMISIYNEAEAVFAGKWPKTNNPLCNAPHTAQMLSADDWECPYSRAQAVYPVASLRANKYWPPVTRINEAYGDRNLFCSCPDIDNFKD